MKRIGVADVVTSQTREKRAMKRLGVIFGGGVGDVSLGERSPSNDLFSTILASLETLSSSAIVTRKEEERRRVSGRG